MNNYFNHISIFSTDCMVNYRLSIIKDFHQYILFDNIYWKDGKICLYNSSKHLLDIFGNAIKQQKTPVSLFTYEFIKNILVEKKYIMGLFESSKLPNSKYLKPVNNYNTFLLYGFENNRFLIHCNTGIQGSESILLDFQELNNMICRDLSVTNQPNMNNELGMPISVLEISPNPQKMQTNEKWSYIKEFYVSTNVYENFNIFNYFLDTNMIDFIRHKYSGCQYQNVANLKILKDMVVYHNLLLSDICPEIVEINNLIIKHLNLVISLYAKYIYTNNNNFIHSSINNMEIIVQLIENNKRIVRNSEDIKQIEGDC